MSDIVRQFTDEGNRRFSAFVEEVRTNPTAKPPLELLTSPATSEPVAFRALIEREPGGKAFASRFEFGTYLVGALASAERTAISFNRSLWNWLTFYYFDQLCPVASDGTRSAGESARYFLTERYRHDRYYRHLVRSPWLAVAQHGDTSKVLLIPISQGAQPLVVVGELFSQFAARQGVFRSKSVMAAIYRMYFDPTTGRPRSAGGSSGGSSRRLGKILKQFELTFDLETDDGNLVVDLLPKEFQRWKKMALSIDQ